jgi:hypothetical protein
MLMRKYLLMISVFLVILSGCTKMIRVDADTYMQNQAFYEGKDILIETNLANVLAQYTQYTDKNVELTAPVSSYRDWGMSGWYLILERDGKKLRCYEENYSYYLPWKALYLVRWARSEGGEVTARGKVRKDGIELCALTYKSLTVNTNAVPIGYNYNYSVPTGGYYRR